MNQWLRPIKKYGMNYKMSVIGFIGDVHCRFGAMFSTINLSLNVKRWFQVGDLGAKGEKYPDLPSNFSFIQGNHEDWDYIQELKTKNAHTFLQNGTRHTYLSTEDVYSVIVLGGNYSAANYQKKTKSLCGDRRRHFTEEDFNNAVAASKNLGTLNEVVILMTHEAPTPFIKGGRDIGIPKINELIKAVKPDIHFYGHHHMFNLSEVEGVPSVGLEYGHQSYVLYDVLDRKIKRVKV